MITVEPTLFHGAPAEERIEREQATYCTLAEIGLSFDRADHEPAATIEDCHAVEKLLGCEICKNLLLCNRQETDFYLVLMPGDKPFKTKDLSKQINTTRLSFASPAHMEELVNITPGSLSVMGLIFDTANRVQLIIDKALLQNEYLGCHPCINTSTLKLKTEDILHRFLPAVHHEPIMVDLPLPEVEM